MTTHVLNPNILFQQYMRRLYNVSAGMFCLLNLILLVYLTTNAKGLLFVGKSRHIHRYLNFGSVFLKLL